LKNRSETGLAGKPRSGGSQNLAGRGQILRAFALRQNARIPSLTILQINSRSIGRKSGEICTGQADLQPISFKSDRLLGFFAETGHARESFCDLK
jgi:hypothetical protein